MTHPTRLLSAVVLALGLFVAPGVVRAENPGPASPAPYGADAPAAERQAYWRARGEEARKRVAESQVELDGADADISRMRRRNHPRGEPRAALFAVRDEARNELEEALHHLEVELPEEARVAGANPDWLH